MPNPTANAARAASDDDVRHSPLTPLVDHVDPKRRSSSATVAATFDQIPRRRLLVLANENERCRQSHAL